ncbi:MAG: hypothetical protein LBG83_04730 [Oscillospiraceae bacterium]|jgi:hypothetical protein|nr:hypothetical protein [Oscillospiraceae bacterium]
MGIMSALSGNPELKERIKGKTQQQADVITYFYGGKGGCFGEKTLSDAEYDALVRSKADALNLQQKALDKLGLDISQVREINPVCLEGWFHNGNKTYSRRGGDRVLRSSSYQITWLFFSSSQVYCYQYLINMDDDGKREDSQEFFYRDIVNFSTKTKAVEYQQRVGGGCMKEPEVKHFTDDTDEFRLVVPGDQFTCAYTQSDAVTRSIRAMQQKLREKKEG